MTPRDELGKGTTGAPGAEDGPTIVRHEEEIEVGKRAVEAGAVSVRKWVETEKVTETVPRQIEHLDEVEWRPPNESDSGEIETLPDGSVSVPILEEELVVTKRVVVRERVVVRKRTVTEQERIEAEVRKERVEVDGEGDAEIVRGAGE